MLNWFRIRNLEGRNWRYNFIEFPLDFQILEIFFNQGKIQLKELNLIRISNCFCNLLQIDYGILNKSWKIVINKLSILLWHQVCNPIALNFNLCALELNKLPDFSVKIKILLNFFKVVRVVIKLVKKYFSFDLLVLLYLFLFNFSGFCCFLYEVSHKFDLSFCCFFGFITDSYQKSGFRSLTCEECDIIIMLNLMLALLKNGVS